MDTIYLDPQTYLPFKSTVTVTDAQGVVHDVEQLQSDYKKVNGLVIAHSMTQIIDGQEAVIVILTEVKINTGIDDALFLMEK